MGGAGDVYLIHEEHGAARPSGHARAYEVTHSSDFTAQRWETVLFRPAGGRRRGDRFGVSRCDSQGSRRAGQDTDGALPHPLCLLHPNCRCRRAAGQLGTGGGHLLGDRAGLGGLRQTHSSPHPHPQVHGHHVLTLMAASRAQPRPACLANLRQGPGQELGSRRPSPHPRLTRPGCTPCSPRCSLQKDPGKVS